MINDKLLDGLSNYVSSDDQFAVMIDGPWGSGKTYFLKNTVIPYFRNERKVVYFSMYGYESFEKLKSDLISRLFISSLGNGLDETNAQSKVEDIAAITKEAVNAVNDKLSAFRSLADTVENLVIKKQLRSQEHKLAPVLIIDDLERISREIHTSDVMGFLLTEVIEPYGYRVIIVGNSQEIKKDELNEFNLTREKVVSRIFPFTYDFSNVKQEFFQNSKIEYLRDDCNWLMEILAEYIRHDERQLNLRTLEFILTTFELIDRKLEQYWSINIESKSYDTCIRRSIFANLFVIATEYRKGILTRENLFTINRLLNTRSFYFFHVKEDEKKTLAEEITDKYHSDENLSQVIMYDNSVNEAIFNGTFNAKIFIENWIKLFKTQRRVSGLDRIADFRNMNDEQLENLEYELLRSSQRPETSIGDILSIINYFVFLDQNGLYLCQEQYLPKLLDALKKNVAITLSEQNALYDRDNIAFMFSALVEDKDVLNQVQSILESAEAEKHRLSTEQLVKAIFDSDYKKVRDINESGLKINIFRSVIDSEHLMGDVLTDHSRAQVLTKYLRSEYIQISNSKDFHEGEISDISELILKVEKYMDAPSKIGKIDKFNLSELLKTLKEILSKFNE